MRHSENLQAMYAILISVLTGTGAGLALGLTDTAAPGWAAAWGAVAALLAMVAVAFVVRRKIAAATNLMQLEMAEGQKALQSRVNDWQHHPKGDPKRFLDSVQRKQADLVRRGLERADALEVYSPWIPLLGRQINAMRVQLLWQLKDFDKVDELLPRSLVLDPFTATMKLARQFAKGEPLAEIEKTYRKARARLRYNQSATLSAAMSWIYVKKGKIDEAYKLLEKACRDNNTDSEPGSTLLRNRDALANNRVKQFSNAGIGDQWYALFLEEPRVRYERRAPTRFGAFG